MYRSTLLGDIFYDIVNKMHIFTFKLYSLTWQSKLSEVSCRSLLNKVYLVETMQQKTLTILRTTLICCLSLSVSSGIFYHFCVNIAWTTKQVIALWWSYHYTHKTRMSQWITFYRPVYHIWYTWMFYCHAMDLLHFQNISPR